MTTKFEKHPQPLKKEFKECDPFYVATLSNGTASGKLNSIADVIEYLASLETDVEKITIRRKYKQRVTEERQSPVEVIHNLG